MCRGVRRKVRSTCQPSDGFYLKCLLYYCTVRHPPVGRGLEGTTEYTEPDYRLDKCHSFRSR
ncbi:hypothetical protein HOLleu_42908 [Holothuria leucospilota]|uniref:Uncharacterized protein n=1 Tax=Holothuria leucospilota TaxID=206669 RepID=A0A9Q0YHL4_HOLLE|nr:hypothetical protein HOLleu_42908 [Holothuria leucospilota]